MTSERPRVLGSGIATRAGIIAWCRQHPGMTEVWNEQIGVTNTIRENILLYLSQEEEEVKKDELRSTIGMTRDSADQHLRFLEEHGFVAKQLDHSMHPEYQLTDKGDELVGELRWGDQS